MTFFTPSQLRAGAVRFLGAYDFDERPAGIGARRLPAWTRPQLPKALDDMQRMPSGVRIAMVSDARELRLRVQTTRFLTPPQTARPVVFDLTIGQAPVRSFSTLDLGNTIVLNRANPEDFKLQRGEPYEVVFDDLPAGTKTCELWLPHNAYVEIRGLALDEGASLAPATEPAAHRWIHHGSSISHCMEAIHPTGTWPAVAARLSGLHLRNLGFGGQCHLDPFVARTLRDSDADVISLKIGINLINADSMRERVFVPALHGFLDTIRERKSHTPIVLVSPIFCPSAEHRPGPTMPDAQGRFITLAGHEAVQAGCLTLTRVRELIEALVKARRAAGDGRLHYLDGLSLFGAHEAADLPDDLHPNPEGYARIGERFARAVFSREGLGLADAAAGAGVA